MTAIQPCALLLLVGPDWQVETVSANVAMLGDHKPASVVGQSLMDLIGSKAIHNLRNRLAWLSNDESEVQDYGVQWADVVFDVRAAHQDDCYLVEAELSVEPRLPDGIGMVRSMTDRLQGDHPEALANLATRQLAALTGFDQIVLCRSDGTPIATNKAPASCPPCKAVDIERLIADRDAEPVPLVGNDESNLLGRAAFAAPEPEARETLSRLGIAATMSLPLRIDGELVGSLHAYHSSPRRIGAERRSVAHLFAERLVARMARQGWEY